VTKRDIILIITLLVIALTSFAAINLWGKEQQVTTAEISLNGELIQQIDLQSLTELKEFSVQGPLGSSVIQVRHGEARILSSPCPDKICVKMGWVKLPGQSAICMPNRILVHIVSEKDNLDSIAH